MIDRIDKTYVIEGHGGRLPEIVINGGNSIPSGGPLFITGSARLLLEETRSREVVIRWIYPWWQCELPATEVQIYIP